jgi:hypothetical protein
MQTRTRPGLLFGPHPASWAVANNGLSTQAVFEVSSLAPEHVVKPGNFGSWSWYRPIDTHWSNASVKTKLHASELVIGSPLKSIFGWSLSVNVQGWRYVWWTLMSPMYTCPLLTCHHISCTLSQKLKWLFDPRGNQHTMRGSPNVLCEWERDNRSDAHYCCAATLHGL